VIQMGPRAFGEFMSESARVSLYPILYVYEHMSHCIRAIPPIY